MNLAAQLEHALPPPLLTIVRLAAELATEHGRLWLVGGPVRDLLLDRPNTDLDLVLEGDAVALATAFADRVGGTLTTHAAFGTATVTLDATTLDFVTARSERYPHPAALPVVTPALIDDDLRRRDFTINTLALSLAPATWGELLDPLGGVEDIARRRLRVLHDHSFIDDPTRMLRAVRFAARFGYQIDARTLALFGPAVPALEQTSSARLLHELRLLIREPAPERALQVLADVDLLAPLAITWGADWGVPALQNARALPPDAGRDHVLLGLLAPGDPRWPSRYPLTGAEQRIFRQVATLQDHIAGVTAAQDDGALDRLLQPFDPAALQIIRLRHFGDDPLVAALDHYLGRLRPIPTLLTGDDLRALRIPPGPRYRTLLSDLRAAQLRGDVTDRYGAEAWIGKQL